MKLNGFLIVFSPQLTFYSLNREYRSIYQNALINTIKVTMALCIPEIACTIRTLYLSFV